MLALRLFALALAAALVCGCGGSDALESPTAARLKGLSLMYMDHIVAKNGNTPANEAELKKHMRTVDAIQLSLAGFSRDKLDDAFVSLRDNEPFVVIYNVNAGTLGAKDGPVIAYEKTGVGGKKLVVNVSAQLSYVSEDRLQEMLKPKTP